MMLAPVDATSCGVMVFTVASCAHRHKNRRFNRAMRQFENACTRGAFGS
jgi:hypothetical protein